MVKSAVLILFIMTFLSSCRPVGDTRGVRPDEKIKIGVLVYKGDDDYISSVWENMEKSPVLNDNVELLYFDAKTDQGLQFEQVDELKKLGADCLAVNIVDTGSFKRMAEKLLESDMPAVFFNRQPDLVMMKAYKNLFFVGTELNEAGVLQGEMIAKAWNDSDFDINGDGVLQYIMLKGEIENAEAAARSEYSLLTLENSGIMTEELMSQSCNWNRQSARDIMNKNRPAAEKAEMIICNNDAMAIGALEALEDMGLPVVPIFGVDATDDAVALINEGKLAGTVKQDSKAMADIVLQAAINGANRRDFLDRVDFEPDESGVAVRIPYQPFTGEN